MFLGRIVTTSKKFEPVEFIEVSSTFLDDGVPTIVIGKKRAIELFGRENVRVLDKKIKDGVYWTYSKTERRIDYERDIEKFYKEVFHESSKRVKYTYFNIFIEKLSIIKKFVDFIENGGRKIIYLSKNEMVIYSGKEKLTGFSFNDTDYIGISREKILSKIKSNPKNIIIEAANFFPKSVKKYVDNIDIFIPYFYYISKI